MATLALPFHRSRTTWLSYVLLGYHTLLQALISAVVPFLRAELGLNYTGSGLYMSANAAGMVLAGLRGDALADRFGRRVTLWGAAGGTVAGLLCLAFGPQAWITLVGSGLCGFFSSLIMIVVQSLLSDLYGAQRGVAISEANIVAGVGSLLAPLLASGAVTAGLGWRAAPGFTLGLLGISALAFFSAPFPPAQVRTNALRGKVHLPWTFWRLWLVVFLGVSVEWSTIFWSPDLLEKIGGFSKAASVSWMSLYFTAAVAGRFSASRLLRHWRALRLLFVAMGLAALGIVGIWLAPLPALRLVGLCVAGLGIGNLYPLGAIETVSAACDTPNLASARATLAAGLAIFSAPFFVGVIADQAGIHGAYGLTLVLLAAAGLIAYSVLRRP